MCLYNYLKVPVSMSTTEIVYYGNGTPKGCTSKNQDVSLKIELQIPFYFKTKKNRNSELPVVGSTQTAYKLRLCSGRSAGFLS